MQALCDHKNPQHNFLAMSLLVKLQTSANSPVHDDGYDDNGNNDDYVDDDGDDDDDNDDDGDNDDDAVEDNDNGFD